MRFGILACAICFSLLGCEKGGPPATPEPPASAHAQGAGSAAPSASAAPAPAAAIDPAVVEAATGIKPELADSVVKVSYPRSDVKVEVDGWSMPPFMGLTSWAGFTPGEKPGVQAMVMGDLVLFEDEVNDAMSAALNNGLQVTALHNHFFFDKPNVFFMHIGGEGSTDALAKGVRAALDAMKAVRAKSPQPKDRFEGPAIPAKSAIDGAKIEAVFGVKGTAKDGMYKVVIGRPAAAAACGCKIGKAMGVNTWAAFAGADDNAVVDGDFAVTEDELQPVLKSLRGSGINIVAIHHHMVGEQPRILFLHYWGRGAAASLAAGVKKAVDLTKSSG
jgi:Domain of Unknown Function (DUF1259)